MKYGVHGAFGNQETWWSSEECCIELIGSLPRTPERERDFSGGTGVLVGTGISSNPRFAATAALCIPTNGTD